MPQSQDQHRTATAHHPPTSRTPPRPPLSFTYWGHHLAYCQADYNQTAHNERTIEIPIADWFINQQSPEAEGLEVGQVLNHYRPTPWATLDRYEPGATHQLDVFDHHQPVDWIVSISTLEHVRWNEDPIDPDGSARALAHLHDLLRPGGQMLITIPLGWHPHLDQAILTRQLPVQPTRQCTIVRTDHGWAQSNELEHHPYGTATRWAAAVWVAEFAR